MGEDGTASIDSHPGETVQENKNTDISSIQEQVKQINILFRAKNRILTTSNAFGLCTAVNVVSSK